MGLDQRTQQRMKELFGGKQCCECGQPAARLVGERFYCPRHFPRGKHRSMRAAHAGQERKLSA